MNRLLITIIIFHIFSLGLIYGMEDETCIFWSPYRAQDAEGSEFVAKMLQNNSNCYKSACNFKAFLSSVGSILWLL